MKFLSVLRAALLVILLLQFPIAYEKHSEGDLSKRGRVSGNRLVGEKSPYLLQHARNPVDWYPWGAEAFEKSRRENKPVFLSIGYSTCHWCHVMEKESFENAELAKIMNTHFVSIKVDREERPDIDHIYMNAVQAMMGSGGWPLSVFLTPEQEPFFGGTYFPPEDRWGRAGFKSLLLSIADAWQNRRSDILNSAAELTKALKERKLGDGDEGVTLDERVLREAYEQLNMRFDSRFGGFGQAPKFPRSHELSFLLRYAKRSGEEMALLMAERTLEEMAKGGMYDQLGGGFHRYSTDGYWHVPHFEKMLYDQAILARTYLEAYQATKKEMYAATAREIFEYVLKEMTSPEGGFYSAEDADSVSHSAGLTETRRQYGELEKVEGAFYVWTESEVDSSLNPVAAKAFKYRYGIEPNGNAKADPQGEFRGKNILYLARSIEETSKFIGKPVNDTENLLRSSKEKLYEIRSGRPRPERDDKILSDWNGLMIASLALGSRILREPRYRIAAERAANFLLEKMVRPDGRIFHRYRDGDAAIDGNLEDYSFFAFALLDLYQTTFTSKYLKEAKRLVDHMTQLFWDEDRRGFYFTPDDGEKLLVRPKELYDGATPSGNSVAALDLLMLGRLTMNREYEQRAEKLFKAFSGDIVNSPTAFTQLLIALDFALGPTSEIVVAGSPELMDVESVIQLVYSNFLPNKVVVFRPTFEPDLEEITELIPFIREKGPLQDLPTLYFCENQMCQLPMNQSDQMKKLLDLKSRTAAKFHE